MVKVTFFIHGAALAWLLVACSLLIGQAKIARASSFQVNPIRIMLTPRGSSSLLAVRNDSKERLRFQIEYFSWDQSNQGDMILNPTNDLIVYPTLLSVDAGAERNVRVGTKNPLVAKEKSYRIFIEELPSAQKSKVAGVRILTRLGVPIFVQPQKPKVERQIDKIAIHKSELFFSLINHGNVHFFPKAIRVKGSDSTGAATLEQDLQAWYILADGSRDYRFELPKSQCPKIKELVIEVEFEANILKEKITLPVNACSR